MGLTNSNPITERGTGGFGTQTYPACELEEESDR